MSPAWALALVAVLAWLPSLAGVFQFDDYNVIVNEPAVHSWQAFLDRASGVRPLLKASYTLNWTLGLGAVGFHVFNLAGHVVNALLAYQVGRELCVRWKVAHQAALLAALLFALHPVQAEAVTYISGRSSSLMAGFYLGALLVYLRGHWTLSSLLFALAVATKETALTLPAALLLCELASSGKLNLRRQWPHWAIFAAGIAFVLLNPRYLELASFGFTRRDVADNLLTQVGGVAYLVGRLIGVQAPNIDPALPVLSSWNFSLAIQASLIAVLMMIGITQLHRRPWLGFGILWFFLHIAPTNSLIPRLDVANDRQLYLAGWGLFLALAVQIGTLRRTVVAALALTCGLAAVARQLDYRSEIALWEADSARAPWNARAYNNLGYAYQQAGRAAEARRAYERALLFDPGHLKARANLLTR
jgi:protein O-mannosyl-transferase